MKAALKFGIRILAFIVVGIALLILSVVALRYWSLMSGVDWNKTSAVYTEDKSIRAFVHWYTDDPFDGWNVSLIWKKEDDKWFVYYLDHKSYGGQYELKKDGKTIVVFYDGNILGKLNTDTNEFSHFKQNFTYKKPIAVIHQSNMDDFQKWSFWLDEKGDRL